MPDGRHFVPEESPEALADVVTALLAREPLPAMTAPAKIDTFRDMVAKNPENHLAHFGLANEAQKLGLHAEAAEHLRAYLARYDDEGNGWGRLAEALVGVRPHRRGARGVHQQGIEASHRFGHPSMAAEIEERIEELGA